MRSTLLLSYFSLVMVSVSVFSSEGNEIKQEAYKAIDAIAKIKLALIRISARDDRKGSVTDTLRDSGAENPTENILDELIHKIPRLRAEYDKLSEEIIAIKSSLKRFASSDVDTRQKQNALNRKLTKKLALYETVREALDYADEKIPLMRDLNYRLDSIDEVIGKLERHAQAILEHHGGNE